MKNIKCVFIVILLFNLVFINHNSFSQNDDDKPNWAKGKLPNKPNELYAVGKANIGPNKILAENKADDAARQELGKILSVKLSSVLENTFKENLDLVNTENTTSQEISNKITKSTTDVTIIGSSVVERWEDEDNNMMYSLVVMKKEQVIEQVNNVIKDDSKKYFVEDKKVTAIQKIDDELEKWDLTK